MVSRRFSRLTFIALPALLAACADGSPTGVEPASFDAAASLSAASCSNVAGTIFVNLTGPASGVGVIAGDLSGALTVAIVGGTAHGNGAQHLRLVHGITTSSGTLTTSDIAVLKPTAPPVYRIDVRYTITGGTGAYTGARGFVRTHGEVDFSLGTVDLQYHGRVCT